MGLLIVHSSQGHYYEAQMTYKKQLEQHLTHGR